MEAAYDPFAVALKTWAAEARIVGDVRRLVEEHDLNLVLVEDVEEALRSDDRDAKWEALLAFLTALAVAIE